MIDPTPQWEHRSLADLTRGDRLVAVHENSVFGLWWALDLDTGALRWQRTDLEPDVFVIVGDGVIVGTLRVTSGPTTGWGGLWAVSIDTGEVLWTDRGPGTLRALWWILTFRGEKLSTEIAGVRGAEIAYRNGRIRRLRDGRELSYERDVLQSVSDSSVPHESWLFNQEEMSIEGATWMVGGALRLGKRETLQVGANPDRTEVLVRRLSREDAPLWTFDSRDHPGCFRDGGIRVHGDYAYLIATDMPYDMQAPAPRDWSLQVLDLTSGELVQRVELSRASAARHSVNLVDDRRLLWRRGSEHLAVHAIRHHG